MQNHGASNMTSKMLHRKPQNINITKPFKMKYLALLLEKGLSHLTDL